MKWAARKSWKQLVVRIKEKNSSDAVIRMLGRSGWAVGGVWGCGVRAHGMAQMDSVGVKLTRAGFSSLSV